MTNPNDSIFPYQAYDSVEKHLYIDNKNALTKREYFAAMAMQGLLAHSCQYSLNTEDEVDVAKRSLLMADALIAKLNK